MRNVSIAMCTYNGELFLPAQLESLQNQTLLPAELVVCDDGSKDNTVQILKQFSCTAPFPVRVFVNAERLDVGANFLHAAELCQSPLIAFCDQDDIWLPEKLRRCVEMCEDSSVLLCHHNFTVVDRGLQVLVTRGGDRLFPHKTGIYKSTTDPRFAALGFTMVFSKSLIAFNKHWTESVNFLDHRLRESHDNWFFCLAFGLGRVAYIDEPLALYRQHGRNVTGGWYDRAGLTVFQRIATGLKHNCKVLLSNVKSFDRRAQFFAEVEATAQGDIKENAGYCEAYYRTLVTVMMYRMKTRKTRPMIISMFRFVTLIFKGAYKRRYGIGGWKSLVGDLYALVSSDEET